MALGARPHGPASAEEMVERGFPGEARLVRHHGRNTSRRDRFTRPGELDPGWTPTAARSLSENSICALKLDRMDKVYGRKTLAIPPILSIQMLFSDRLLAEHFANT